jgi:predicted nucleic acid-binding protein
MTIPAEENIALVDSSFLVALADRRDQMHQIAVNTYRQLLEENWKLFTTNYLVSEALDMIRAGLGPQMAQQWLRDMRLTVYHADESDEKRARTLVVSSRNPNGLSITDAISAVVMNRLGVQDVIAVDPHLSIEAF